MKILLIRHSKTILDKNNSSLVWRLSDEGIELCEKLSNNQYIKNCKAIYSSFQTKALETALLLAKPNNISIKPFDNLTETTSVTNGFFANYEEEVKKWHDGGYRINNGETKEESLNRFNKAIETITTAEIKNDIIGIVSHANVLAIFSEQFSNKDSYTIHNSLSMPDIALFDTATKQFISYWGTNHD
ncbi:histidine phosphatase family protein [Candidatus Dojkabacteria bacterium]|nr:histidine phosphatase family protein [Candidatus Dojkabacteria bacterium]